MLPHWYKCDTVSWDECSIICDCGQWFLINGTFKIMATLWLWDKSIRWKEKNISINKKRKSPAEYKPLIIDASRAIKVWKWILICTLTESEWKSIN